MSTNRVEDNLELKEKAKKFVLENFNLYKNRQGLVEIWEKSDKLFNNISTKKYYEGAADLFSPETRRACKTLINFIDEVLFNQQPSFTIKGVGGESDNRKAEVITKLTSWQLNKTQIRKKLRCMYEQLVKYGVAITKFVWDTQDKYLYDNIIDAQDLSKKILYGENVKLKKTLKTKYDNIDFQVKNIRNMFWNYYVTWENQTCIIERSKGTWSHLKAMESRGVYFGIDEIKKNDLNEKSSSMVNSMNEPYSHIKDITGLTENYSSNIKEYEILEAWCNFDIDDDGIDEECVITLVDEEYLVRLDINPYENQEKPYQFVAWEPIEGTSLGIGIPQLCEKSQIALNDFYNQIMDNITSILNCMKVVDDLADIPDAMLKSRPDGIIRSKTGVDAVEFLRPPITANEGLKAVQLTKDDIRQLSGATVTLQGMPARYDTTASEINQMVASSARDIFAKIREIEDNIIIPILKLTYEYDLQYMDREQFIRIIGKDAAESLLNTKPEWQVRDIILGDYDFIWLGATQTENKVIKSQQLINFLNISLGVPAGIVDIPKLIQKIWKVLGDNDDIILPQPTSVLVSPQDENILILQGERPHAKTMENHQYHIIIHNSLSTNDYGIENIKQEHIQEHMNIIDILKSESMAPPVAPQEQPKIQPEIPTEKSIGRIEGLPKEV